MNEDELIRRAMSVIGKRTSAKKAAAVRENGRKGGRPQGAAQIHELRPLPTFKCKCSIGPNGSDAEHKSYCPRGQAYRRRTDPKFGQAK